MAESFGAELSWPGDELGLGHLLQDFSCPFQLESESIIEELASNSAETQAETQEERISAFRSYGTPPFERSSSSNSPLSSSSSTSPSPFRYMTNWLSEKHFEVSPNALKHSGFDPAAAQGTAAAASEPEPAAAADNTQKAASHNHKIAERKRRRTEADLLNEIRSCIPCLKKKDKVSTLQGALEYMNTLKREKRELEIKLSSGSWTKNEDEDEVSKSPRSNLTDPEFPVSNSNTKMQLKINTGGKQPEEVFRHLPAFLTDFDLAIDAIQWDVHSCVNLTVHYKEDMQLSLVSSEEQLKKALEARMCSDASSSSVARTLGRSENVFPEDRLRSRFIPQEAGKAYRH